MRLFDDDLDDVAGNLDAAMRAAGDQMALGVCCCLVALIGLVNRGSEG